MDRKWSIDPKWSSATVVRLGLKILHFIYSMVTVSKFGNQPKIVFEIRKTQNIRIFPDNFRIVEEKYWIFKNVINKNWLAWKNEVIWRKIRNRKKRIFSGFSRIFFENHFFDIQVKNEYWISNFMKKFQLTPKL